MALTEAGLRAGRRVWVLCKVKPGAFSNERMVRIIGPAGETPWTRKLWIYDLRTNQHFTLKTCPLQRADLGSRRG